MYLSEKMRVPLGHNLAQLMAVSIQASIQGNCSFNDVKIAAPFDLTRPVHAASEEHFHPCSSPAEFKAGDGTNATPLPQAA